ncbi:hypothetical protein WAI453_002146 [Rhynchosporium graminicola]
MASSEKGLSKYVTLVSSDGFEFVVLREAACHSGAIRKMLDPKSNFRESSEGRCVFEEIKYVTASPCDFVYLYYRPNTTVLLTNSDTKWGAYMQDTTGCSGL